MSAVVDARERVRIVLGVARRHGIVVEESLFASSPLPLAERISQVRGGVKALDWQLGLCEELARREDGARTKATA